MRAIVVIEEKYKYRIFDCQSNAKAIYIQIYIYYVISHLLIVIVDNSFF